MGRFFDQVVVLVGFFARTIGARRGSVAAAAFGIAGVVAVLVGVLSIGRGFEAAMTATGDEDAAIVLRGGADTEMTSILGRDDVKIVAEAPGVLAGADGPLASPELFVIVDLPKKSTGTAANVPFRGVETVAFGVHDEVEIVAGRAFAWGTNEVVVGRGAAAEIEGLEVGSTIRLGRNEWQVVGQFAAGGGIAESEIWTDAAVLQPAYRRGTSFQSVLVRLESPEAFTTFSEALEADPRLHVKVVREADYWAEQSVMLTTIIQVLGSLITVLMSFGAVFGALNTMYSAVSSRTREVATLRALGFPAGPVVVAVLLESVAISLAGGLIGGVLAWLAFDGYRAATLNWQSFSQVTFAFAVTPELLATGALLALLLGLVGGLPPAIRAARLPIASALREL